MDLSRPHAVFGHGVAGDVLAALARTNRPLSGRHLARLIARSDQRVREVLHYFVAQGIANVQDATPSLLYTLNRDHVAAPAAELLANLAAELQARMRSSIERWETQPIHVSLFGSAARGDGDVDSDIDIFVVRPRAIGDESRVWRAQLDRLARDVHAWSGNDASVSEISEAELRRLRTDRPPVVDELVSDAVTLAGPPPDELFRTRR